MHDSYNQMLIPQLLYVGVEFTVEAPKIEPHSFYVLKIGGSEETRRDKKPQFEPHLSILMLRGLLFMDHDYCCTLP